MKLIRTIVLAALPVLFLGCNIIKTAKFIKSGAVSQSAFKTEVPFEMRFGLIVIKVKIHGREYSFILDTGAPDVISKELAVKLGVKVAGSGKAGDSQGSSGSVGYTAIDSIGIGDLQFLNTGAAIADLRQSNEIACLDVDGLIGANLMRKAVWHFDYQRHIITIANDRDSLVIPPNAQTIKFHASRVGTPLIDIQMNGQTDHSVAVDLGSNSDFRSSTKTLNKLKENGLRTNTYSYGFGPSGLYGKGKEDTTWYAVITDLRLGSLKLSNQVVSFSKNEVKTVGTNFFKNYRLIFDWSSNELTMIPVSPYDNTTQKTYKFSFVLKDHQVLIGSLYATKDAVAEGPQLGDRVLEIDGKDYRSCSIENWCTLLSQRFENPTVSVLVKRGDKELHFNAAKEALFLKK